MTMTSTPSHPTALPPGSHEAMPDLVLKVRQRSTGWDVIYAMVGEYLGAGARVVVILDQVSGSVAVYRTDDLPCLFHPGDELTVPEILPGFAVKVSSLFE